MLNIHTVSDITTLDGKETKPGIVDGTLEDRTSRYRSPRPLPWKDAHSRIMQKLINRLTIGTKRLITRLGDFDTAVQPSQKYLFFIDRTSTRLVDMRGRTTVEHILGSARRNIQHFSYPDYPANATYHRLQPADSHLGDK